MNFAGQKIKLGAGRGGDGQIALALNSHSPLKAIVLMTKVVAALFQMTFIHIQYYYSCFFPLDLPNPFMSAKFIMA